MHQIYDNYLNLTLNKIDDYSIYNNYQIVFI